MRLQLEYAALLSLAALASAAAAPVVTIDSGVYTGTQTTVSGSDTPINQFIGIKYAEITERFRASKLLAKSGEKKNANSVGPICVQNNGGGALSMFTNESEDCLYLNIFTPASNGTAPKAVLIFFHGGGLFGGGIGSPLGGPAPDASQLAVLEDFIVVAPAYRVTVFGFPGAVDGIPKDEYNVGFRDQKLALEWVQRNIGAFGGDPKKVTISGQSGGAISVDSHLVSSIKNPPYRAAISQSGGMHTLRSVMPTVGVPLTGTGTGNKPGESAFRTLAKAVGCTDAAAELACVQKKPWKDLKAKYTDLAFWPVPDGGQTFWEDFDDARRQKKEARVPVLIGDNFQEALIFTGKLNKKTIPEWAAVIYPDKPADQKAIVDAYPFGPGTDFATKDDALLQLHSEFQFACITAYEASLIAATGVPTYRYLFNGSLPLIGQSHGAEGTYLWGTRLDAPLSRTMQKTWGRFVRDPANGPGWPTMLSGGNGSVLVGDIGGQGDRKSVTRITADELDKRCKVFWNSYDPNRPK